MAASSCIFLHTFLLHDGGTGNNLSEAAMFKNMKPEALGNEHSAYQPFRKRGNLSYKKTGGQNIYFGKRRRVPYLPS